MPNSTNLFYQCDNPTCQLRFPGIEGSPRWNRCPVCRSTIHVVAERITASEAQDLPVPSKLSYVGCILDNVRSVWNVGSIFRTADGLGINKLYLCGITPTPDNSKLSKTALGAEVSIAWEKINNGVILARKLKDQGTQLWALENSPGAEDLFLLESELLVSPQVLVIGNEISGIDPGIIEMSDRTISIPMMGKKKSFNVSVAFGIAASYLLYRQIVSQGSLNMFPHT